MNPNDYHDIGKYLSDSRESLNISLEDAAKALHIRSRYLYALENGDLKDMPGKAYVRGYIRTYTEYLGVDSVKVLEAYALILGPRLPDLFIPEPSLEQNLPSRTLVRLSLVGLLTIYGCWYYGFHERVALVRNVPEMPMNFAHLLDKTPPPAMDITMQDCLESDDAGCYVTWRAEATHSDAGIYDVYTRYFTPPQP